MNRGTNVPDLCVTTDFMDNVLRAERHIDEGDLDAMMAYSASLGASRHEWVLDTIWALYDEGSPVGFDLLAAACDAAHRHGMRFDVVYKPFEGAITHSRLILPPTFPRLEGVPLLDEPIGLGRAVRPFVAAHPEMRMARRPDADVEPGGRVAAVRLIKNDDAPAPFGPEDLSLWTSPRNGGFTRYDGPVSFSESCRPWSGYPYDDRQCRVVTLGGLELPADARFFVVRCEKRSGEGDFANAIEDLAELVNEDGRVIPSMPGWARLDAEALFERTSILARLGMCRYSRRPEVRDLLQDRERFLAACEGMFVFDSWWEDVALDQVGEVAVTRGKPRHVYGVLNPVYPEVREHWLDEVRSCIDRGVDGVNFRVANHNRPYEPWSYGFNEPTLERSKRPGNAAEAARINGEAYTRFLREAADLLHANGKEIGVHVHGLVFRHNDRAANNSPLPRNIEWQWEVWLREIADYVEFRGANMLRPENVREVVDRIGVVAREAGIPFIYQCARSGGIVHFDGPHPGLEREIEWVRERPDVTFYNLYETANFTRMDAEGRFEGSPAVAELVARGLR